MSIKELLEAANNTPVTSEEINALRLSLEEQSDEQTLMPSSTSQQFLARTYSL
ncbi:MULTISPECIES: hypothetical protein [Acinetobacter]|uniref:hypothetical protein n=1 Tax=Acinetobacter TaxID=469 RepID=UPI00141B3D0D|nr:MULTISPECIES: hypothetical protein [Acinetobacter]MCS4296354.1 hypothetical protein [Acinetobacter guillouiae]MCW2250475.1 hypothetical protein [Acinetobacter sp. BIGb0204]NII37427.1 hypothetical protein [Acinetobacter sp. BIGb0196]